MNNAIKNKYFETTDYSKFKKARGNRPVDEAHVNQLKKLTLKLHMDQKIMPILHTHTLVQQSQVPLKTRQRNTIKCYKW